MVVTYNQGDFKRLHEAWQAADRHHCGIIVGHKLPLGVLIACLERAARLLTPEVAQNQLLQLDLFDSEERSRAYLIALGGQP